jgi:hypothetical protein
MVSANVRGALGRALPLIVAAGLGFAGGVVLGSVRSLPADERAASAASSGSDAADGRGGRQGAEAPRRREQPLRAREPEWPSPSGEESERAEGETRRELMERIAQLEREALELRRALRQSTGKVSELEASAEARLDLRRFDLSPEDWGRLGREGTLMLRLPCALPRQPARELLEELGLTEGDWPAIAEAFERSARRVWAALAPACAETLGGSKDQASTLGARGCRHAILAAGAADGAALRELRKAAAFLAGDAPATPEAERGPVEAMVLALSQEQRLVERELAEHFGPDEADRIVFSDGLCFTEATHTLGPGATSRSERSGRRR